MFLELFPSRCLLEGNVTGNYYGFSIVERFLPFLLLGLGGSFDSVRQQNTASH